MAPTPSGARPSSTPTSGHRFPLDPTNVDLTDLDLVRVVRHSLEASETIATRAGDLAREAAYVVVGLGLLNYQRAQVRRREFERARRR